MRPRLFLFALVSRLRLTIFARARVPLHLFCFARARVLATSEPFSLAPVTLLRLVFFARACVHATPEPFSLAPVILLLRLVFFARACVHATPEPFSLAPVSPMSPFISTRARDLRTPIPSALASVSPLHLILRPSTLAPVSPVRLSLRRSRLCPRYACLFYARARFADTPDLFCSPSRSLEPGKVQPGLNSGRHAYTARACRQLSLQRCTQYTVGVRHTYLCPCLPAEAGCTKLKLPVGSPRVVVEGGEGCAFGGGAFMPYHLAIYFSIA